MPILLARFSPERFRGRIIAMDAWVAGRLCESGVALWQAEAIWWWIKVRPVSLKLMIVMAYGHLSQAVRVVGGNFQVLLRLVRANKMLERVRYTGVWTHHAITHWLLKGHRPLTLKAS